MQSKQQSNRGKWAWILVADIFLLFFVSSIFFPAIEGDGKFAGLSCFVGLFSLSAVPIIFISMLTNRPLPASKQKKPLHKIEGILSDEPDDLLQWLSDEEEEDEKPPDYIFRNPKGAINDKYDTFDERFAINTEPPQLSNKQNVSYGATTILLLLVVAALIISVILFLLVSG